MSEPDDVPARRELHIRKPYFDLIASGVKTIEVRVGYPSVRKIQPGRQPDFVCGDQRSSTRVSRMTEYASFEDLLKHEHPVAIGGEPGEDGSELLAVIRDIYPPEKERLGVLAIAVELITGVRDDRGVPSSST